MKIFCTLLFLCCACAAFSQTVLIKGTASDTSARYNEFNAVRVVLNDTLRKWSSANSATISSLTKKYKKDSIAQYLKLMDWGMKMYNELSQDTNLVVKTKPDRTFQINANLKDTLFFSANRYITQKYAVADLVKMDKIAIRLVPEICIEREKCNDNKPKHYVVIAEKIDVKRIDPYYCGNLVSFDGQYVSKYKLLKTIYGTVLPDTINFTAFDHYGTPKFSYYKYVMLFLSEYCGKLYHEKYQFFDVYPTKDGRWARPGDPYRYDKHWQKDIQIVKLNFKDNLSFDIEDEDEHVIKEKYPRPYFRMTKNRAFPLTGVYAEELLEIKKNGVLKARNIELK